MPLMTQAATFPPEIFLHIFSFMELKALIASQGVCQEWRQMVPLADLHHNRRKLLNLFHDVINNEQFLLSQAANQQPTPIDRQAYIDQLLQQYPKVPDDFKLWVLEWPSRTVIDGLWPSFPLEEARYNAFNRRSGVNWIALNPPRVITLVYSPDIDTEDYEVIPAVLAYRHSSRITWIVFDDRPELFGKVYTLYDVTDFIDAGLDSEDGAEEAYVHADWIAYISFVWKEIGPHWFSRKIQKEYVSPYPIDIARITHFDSSLRSTPVRDMPTPMWTRRHELRSQAHMKPYWQRR